MSLFLMWLLSSILAIVTARDDSTVTFLGQECDGAVTPQVYVKGGQPGAKVKNLQQCLDLCQASNDCQSVTFYHREAWTDSNNKNHAEKKWCKHFYTACGSLKKSSGATTVTHLANMDSYWSLASIGFERECQGTPLSSDKQDSLTKCMTACDSEPNCKSVTFFLAAKTCKHFSTTCETSTTNENNRKEDVVSMVRRTDQRGALQSKCDEIIVNGSPREKWVKSLAVADLKACETSCNDDAKCQSITFRKDWTKNCNHFETKCLHRQPQSMAIAKSLKLDMPKSGKNSVYHVDKEKSDFCRSPNAVCDCSYRCKPGYNFIADEKKSGKCSANKCSCPNGSPKTGAACTKDGAVMCETCKPNYTINADKTKCSANKCSCPNGSPKTGAACTKHGAAMCESCKGGFAINADQTKCSDKRAEFCSSANAVCGCKPGFTINADQTKCSAFVLPSGVQHNVPSSKLTGWVKYFDQPYSQATTQTDLTRGLPVSATHIMVCGSSAGSASPTLCAAASKADVLRKTPSTTSAFGPYNGVYWYNYGGKSFGFSDSPSINLNPADENSGSSRLSWHIDVRDNGGFRLGNIKKLNDSNNYRKQLYYFGI